MARPTKESEARKAKPQTTEKKAAVILNNGVLTQHLNHWTDALAKFAELPCETEAQELMWGKWLSASQDTIKTLEDARKKDVGPFNDVVSEINADYRTHRAPAEAFKALAKEKIGACQLARQLAADAAQEAARLAAQAGDSEAVYEALAAVPDTVKVAGAATRFEYQATVVDFAALDDSFKLADDKKLKAYANLGGEPAPLPGVVFNKVAVVAARGGKK